MLRGLLLIVPLLVGACAAPVIQAPVGAPQGKATPAGWRVVNGEGYSVLAPGPLLGAPRVTPMPTGEVTSRGGFVEDQGLRYSVTSIDFPGSLARVMDHSGKAHAAAWKELRDGPGEAPVPKTERGGVAGWQTRVRLGDHDGIVREFWLGDSLYLVAVVGPGPLDEAAVLWFLDSFRIEPSWRRITQGGGVYDIEVPRRASHDRSSNGETTLHRFLIGQDELCRVFEQATDARRPGSRWQQDLIDTLRKGLTIVSEAPGPDSIEVHVVRPSGNHEVLRAFAPPGFVLLVTAGASAEGVPSPEARRCLDSVHILDHGPGVGPRAGGPG